MPHCGVCEAVQTRGARGQMMEALIKGASIMKFILCAALVAMSGVAGATVYKCVDQDGQVLLTDADCPSGSAVEPYVERVAAGEWAAPDTPVTQHSAPVAQAVRSRWADLPRPLQRKSVTVDGATLQAAHQNMQMQDELHKQRRLLSAR